MLSHSAAHCAQNACFPACMITNEKKSFFFATPTILSLSIVALSHPDRTPLRRAAGKRKGRQMASWLVKALVQRGIGALPNPQYCNGLFQYRVTHSLDLTKERFEASLYNCR